MLGGSLAIVAALALLVAVASRGTLTYYYTVEEIRQSAPATGVRVAGAFVPGSLQEGGLGEAAVFALHEAGRPEVDLTVRYDGPLPDTLRSGEALEVVVEGDYDGEGGFAASQVLTKCPSRYEGAVKP